MCLNVQFTKKICGFSTFSAMRVGFRSAYNIQGDANEMRAVDVVVGWC
jgi:hypothetical protein